MARKTSASAILKLAMRAETLPGVAHDALEQVLSVVEPERVILFGSWARGEAGPDSDLDLLVVLPFDGDRHQVALALLVALADLSTPKDVIVLSPEEWAEKRGQPGSVAYGAAREGVTLYASRGA
jgi:uncharacterized protein